MQLHLYIVQCKTSILKPAVTLKIDKPCSEDWNGMAPVAGGRFCNSCAKNVVDFTGMTDSEVAKYLLNSNGNICGRVKTTQMHRHLEVEKEAGAKQVMAISWFLRAAVLVGFTLPLKATPAPVVTQASPFKHPDIPTTGIPRSVEIKGTVSDNETGKPIANAQIIINAADTLVADSAGSFNAIINLTDSTATDIKIEAVSPLYYSMTYVRAIPEDGVLEVTFRMGVIPLVQYDPLWGTPVRPYIIDGPPDVMGGPIMYQPIITPSIFSINAFHKVVDYTEVPKKRIIGTKLAGLYKGIAQEEEKPAYYLYFIYAAISLGGLGVVYKLFNRRW